MTQSLSAVEIKATIDRNPVNVNESFQLTFTATESPDGSPDFSPLHKDFQILGQNQRSNYSNINGQSNNSIQWILKLLAKKTGNIAIPIIFFGDDQSSALTVLVNKTATPISRRSDDLFLEVEATPTNVYVQSQILYTLRLFRKVQIGQANLTEPQLDDAIVEKLADDKNYSSEVNGVDYLVTERNYAIFPQKSGLMTIAPLELTAEIVSRSNSRFNGFFNRQTTRTKHIKSNPVVLDVKPAPASFTGKRWIPAKNLYLEEKWSADVKKMQVGEPLTRTLTILAKDTTVAQLPELHDEINNQQLKTYPDQPVLKEKKNPDGLIAFREEKIAFIPSGPGTYTLPAIEIPWFNTETQTMEVARIPETQVIAISSAQTDLPPQANTPTTFPVEESDTLQPAPLVYEKSSDFWKWLSVFLGCGWLLSLVLFFRKSKTKQRKTTADPKEIKLKETVKQLKRACASDDKTAAKDALLSWGKIQFNSTNLTDLGNHCAPELGAEIQLLNKNLYANQSEQWSGKQLFKTFTELSAHINKKNNMKQDYDGLEPLYKV